MLVLLAHYKLIEDDEALRLDELEERTERLRKIQDQVDLEIVRSLMKKVYYRRKYLAIRDERRVVADETEEIPGIVVEASPPTPGRQPPSETIPSLWRRATRSVAKKEDTPSGSRSGSRDDLLDSRPRRGRQASRELLLASQRMHASDDVSLQMLGDGDADKEEYELVRLDSHGEQRLESLHMIRHSSDFAEPGARTL